jgi:hypothetical protein
MSFVASYSMVEKYFYYDPVTMSPHWSTNDNQFYISNTACLQFQDPNT